MLKRILFIHHGHARGGAFLSLLYLVKSLDRNLFEPIVCNGGVEQDPKVNEIFSKEGFETCNCRLPRFAHTTGGSYNLAQLKGWWDMMSWFREYGMAKKRLAMLIGRVRPHVVHLNSVTLAPYAAVPRSMKIPTVVHVRESVIEGVVGFRKRWLRWHLVNHANQVIAICKDNLERLELPEKKGVVIYNPVDFNMFDFRIDSASARKALGIADSAKVVLFGGGSVWEAKGLFEFLEAMSIIKEKEQHLICIMPSFQFPSNPNERMWTIKRRIAWLLGMFRKLDHRYRFIKTIGLRANILNSEFVYDIEQWVAASDVVCVPHVQPHFSRTVMEAGAMKKPVVAFEIGGVKEVVHDGETGLMVKQGDVPALAAAVLKLLNDKVLANRLGAGGYCQAVKTFDAVKNAAKIADVYEKLNCYGY
jgi:glycosyltransferase involved in cell wall biosynthesis